MKRLFMASLIGAAIIVGLLSMVPAHAGWNLKQNDDGTTSWVREDVNSVERSYDVGETHLTVFLEDISSASTTYVAIPLTNFRVSYIQSVIFNTITAADAVLSIWKLDSSGTTLTEITNAVSRMTVAAESVTGTVDTFTPTNAAANFIEQDEVIAIHTDGGSTNDSDATLTIKIVPR